jgi:hypothetical protein
LRKDLQKQLCEQERHGSSRSYKEVRRLKQFNEADEEFQAGREGIKVRYVKGWGELAKDFSENFAPLWGIIRKNAGRPWNDVYSELTDIFDMRSHVNAHILIHLWQKVERHTYMVDEEVWIKPQGYTRECSLEKSTCEYFIHPVSGLLLKNPFWQGYRNHYRREPKVDPNVHVVSDKVEYRRRDAESPWFCCTIEKLPRPPGETAQKILPYSKRVYHYTKYPDCLEYDRWTGKRADWDTPFCKAIRSAGHKELKKIGLAK